MGNKVLKRHDLISVSIKDDSEKLMVIYEIFEFTQKFIYEEIKKIVGKNSSSSYGHGFSDDMWRNNAKMILDSVKSAWTDVRIFLDLLENLNDDIEELTIALEENYVDRDYRDSYYMHYSEEHSETSRFCVRLLFFKGDFFYSLDKIRISQRVFKKLDNCFIGSMVIRPIPGCSIGRTLISPLFISSLKNVYIRWTEYKVYYRGHKFLINAFPFRMQDMVTTTCAETTLLNIFDYYSKQYVDYKYMLPSDIYQICKKQHNDRIIPTEGIPYDMISRVFYESGFAPKLYFLNNKKKTGDLNSVKPIKMLDYYLESGMPVAVGLDYGAIGHSIVCIGHGKCTKDLSNIPVENTSSMHDDGVYYIDSANLHNNYIFQDDSKSPYIIFEKSQTDDNSIIINHRDVRINSIVAPLYRRMYMDAVAAKTVILKILAHPRYTPYPKQSNSKKSINIGQATENPLIIRLFIASSRHFKESRLKSLKNNFLYELYQEIPLPNFIWVCELYSKESYVDEKPFGEIILDATSPAQGNPLDSCLMICYPERVIAKNIDGSSMFNKEFDPMDWINMPNSFSNYMFNAYKRNLNFVI